MQARVKMKAVVFLLGFMLVGASGYKRTARYDDQIVVKCELTERLGTVLERDLVDLWGFDEEKRLHLRLGVQLWSELQSTLPECSVVIENVEEYVEEYVSKAEKEMFNNSRPEAEWFEEYHDYEAIVGWYSKLANDYPNLVTFYKSIGESLEGRDMPAVHIGTNSKYTVYFQCQIHAREWISGAVCMYIANRLCESYGKIEQVTNLLNAVEFVFVPLVNPDGYEYTWNGDRLWRKNRRVNPGSSCDGVDLNRNYDDHWGGEGSSSNPCSETYHGTSAASEPETQYTQNYFKAQKSIVAAIDWHSFSQLILRPYGWTKADCPDEQRLSDVGQKMSDAAIAIHGKEYDSIKSIDLYATTGSASDWFYSDNANEDHDFRAAGYTIELRDTGRYGFLLPPEEIIPCGEEMFPAVLYLAESMYMDPLPK
jgi:hypothetical protein